MLVYFSGESETNRSRLLLSEHQQLFLSTGRRSALCQEGITDTHPPSVDPFSPTVQQKGAKRTSVVF